MTLGELAINNGNIYVMGDVKLINMNEIQHGDTIQPI